MLSRIFKSGVAQRLAKGFGANFMGRLWVAGVQLLLVPLLVTSWGADGYGAWLMLTTIPYYILLADFGAGNALSVELTRAISRGDKAAARKALNSTWIFVTALSMLFLGFALVTLWLWPFGAKVGSFPAIEYRLAILFVLLDALAGLQQATLRGVFYATNRYATETVLQELTIPIAGILVAAAAMTGGGVALAAAGAFSVRLATVFIYLFLLRRIAPWSTLGVSAADMETLKRMINPSISALMLSLSNALSIQGVLLTVGWALGPAAAGLYGSARMLTRVPLQFSGLLVRASLPELTRSQEVGNHILTRRLVRLNIGVTLVGVVPSVILLIALGPSMLKLLSNGELVGDRALFAALALSAGFAALWTALAQPLVALNRQSEFSYWAIAIYSLVAVQPLLIGNSLNFAAFCAMLGEIVVLIIVWGKSR